MCNKISAHALGTLVEYKHSAGYLVDFFRGCRLRGRDEWISHFKINVTDKLIQPLPELDHHGPIGQFEVRSNFCLFFSIVVCNFVSSAIL